VEHPWDISAELKAQIRHLPPDLKQRVWETVDIIFRDPETGKLLSEDLAGYRSYRIGKYRLIYRIKNSRLVLIAVGPRADIYERLVLEIGRAKIRERAAKYGAKACKCRPLRKRNKRR
jgi:mRNA interferase RelE/StbE